MSEKIGDTWFYLVAVPRQYRDPDPPYAIERATVIGETPRKWILRKCDHLDLHITTELGEAMSDFSILKRGEAQRTGRNWRKHEQEFFATEALARAAISRKLAGRWADKHRWQISRMVERVSDPALLKKIADLVGYKEGET